MSLGQTLSGFWHSIQADLFPWLEEELGPLGGRYRRFVTVLEFARVESFLPHFRSLPGRPVEDRAALARAFIAKAVFDIPTTRALIERLQVDRTLRRLCGWTYAGEIPSEATFSRAFAEFSASALPARLHEALIEKTLGDHLVGHVSRDATAIEARERPAPKPRAEKPKRKRGRPRKGEERPRELRRVPDIAGRTVTADALLTQRALASYLLDRGAAYLFTVKSLPPRRRGATSRPC